MRYQSLREYFYLNPKVRKGDVALMLGVWPSRLTTLQDPERPQRLDDDLVQKLADLLNQPPDYIRQLYGKAA